MTDTVPAPALHLVSLQCTEINSKFRKELPAPAWTPFLKYRKEQGDKHGATRQPRFYSATTPARRKQFFVWTARHSNQSIEPATPTRVVAARFPEPTTRNTLSKRFVHADALRALRQCGIICGTNCARRCRHPSRSRCCGYGVCGDQQQHSACLCHRRTGTDGGGRRAVPGCLAGVNGLLQELAHSVHEAHVPLSFWTKIWDDDDSK